MVLLFIQAPVLGIIWADGHFRVLKLFCIGGSGHGVQTVLLGLGGLACLGFVGVRFGGWDLGVRV